MSAKDRLDAARVRLEDAIAERGAGDTSDRAIDALLAAHTAVLADGEGEELLQRFGWDWDKIRDCAEDKPHINPDYGLDPYQAKGMLAHAVLALSAQHGAIVGTLKARIQELETEQYQSAAKRIREMTIDVPGHRIGEPIENPFWMVADLLDEIPKEPR